MTRVYHIPTQSHGTITGWSGSYVPMFHVKLDTGVSAIATGGDLIRSIWHEVDATPCDVEAER